MHKHRMLRSLAAVPGNPFPTSPLVIPLCKVGRISCLIACGLLLAAMTSTTRAQQTPAGKPAKKSKTIRLHRDFSKELPLVAPKSPEDSLRCIHVHPDFRVELVAAEPLVHDPVAVDFDEDGRLFVAELTPYNAYAAQDFTAGGSIRMLEDTDGDGRIDKSVVYVDDLQYPTAVACWDGGVFVADAPDLLYCKDTDGDDKADIRNVVFTGFGQDKAGEAHLNSLRWGFDNRFHLSTSGNGGEVRPVANQSSQPVSVRGRGLSFDPRRLTGFELTSGGGQHGMSMDNWGRKFVCSNSVPAQTLMYDDRYLVRNPYLAAPPPAKDIFPDGKFTKLMRISEPEPWRVLRTRLRAAGDVGGEAEGGKPFGFFTAGTGVTIYRGNAWPHEYHGNLLVGDVANNIIFRARLETDGLSLLAQRADPDAEFLASTDIWFRPVQLANGPDGQLYVLDMYRSLIEGTAFLPADILDHLDPVGGYDRGRIYRIVARGSRPSNRDITGPRTTAALVQMLGDGNGWHRDTASRLLYQRQDKAAIESLRQLTVECPLPEGRMTALYSLQGLGALDADIVLQRLEDPSVKVRQHAIRIAEGLAADSDEVRDRLVAMADTTELDLAYQLAFSLGAVESIDRNAALISLMRQFGTDPWLPFAVQSSLGDGAGGFFRALACSQVDRKQPHIREFLVRIATQIGAADRIADVAMVLQLLNDLPESERSFSQAIIEALVTRQSGAVRSQLLSAAGGPASSILLDMLTTARHKILDAEASDEVRVTSIRLLRLADFADVKPSLAKLLSPAQPHPVQVEALRTLSEFDDQDVAMMLLNAWPKLSPSLRSIAIETLLSRTAWTVAFLSRVETRQIGTGDIDPGRMELLKKHTEPSVSALAQKLFSTPQLAERQEVVAAYQKSLELEGDVAEGKKVFNKVCAACHRLEDTGTAIGADLKGIRNRGLAAVLLNILDPNREVKPEFVNYLLVTNDGLTITGMIAEENANSMTIRRPDGSTMTVFRHDIEELRGTGLSYMPEGLEKAVDITAMANLLAYLSSVK